MKFTKAQVVSLIVAVMLLFNCAAVFGDEQINPESVAIPAEETVAQPEAQPVQEAPAQEVPTQETPVQETPAQEVPAQEAPVQEVPAQKEPIKQNPEAPKEEIPQEPETDKDYGYYDVWRLTMKVYAEPDENSEIIGEVEQGDKVRKLNDGYPWLKVWFEGQIGYLDIENKKAAEENEAQPAEEIPAEEIPAEEIPAEEIPTEEIPAEEIPAEEIPAEEAPIEEIPAEEIPVEEQPVEEAPAEEIPQETEKAENLMVIANAAVIRETADGMSAILANVPNGAEVVLLENSPDWYKVDWNGVVGYIFKGETGDRPEAVQPTLTIFSSRRKNMSLGETVYLTSLLEGLDGSWTLHYQWQVNKGSGWEDVPGANGDSYSFAADLETLSWSWRLQLTGEQ